MAGVKGKTGRHTNRSNQWLKGTVERSRTDEVFAFKPKLGVYEAIKQDIEQREISKTEWLDMAVEAFLGGTSNVAGEPDQAEEETSDINPLAQEAIAFFLESKRVAVARERKAKRPDKGLIEQWEKEIEQLESMLG